MQLKNKRISVIDIGTNTCLLLIAELQNGKLETIVEKQEIPRLGKGVDSEKNISKDAFERVLSVLKSYKEISEAYGVDSIFGIGTSALRDASNKDEFIENVLRETGIIVKILSGKEESKMSYEGAVFDFDNKDKLAVVDIGGGSTEVSFVEKGYTHKISMDIGSLRIKERFFSVRPTEGEINAAKEFVNENLKNIAATALINTNLIGVAGTITTLSAIKLGLKVFEPDKLHKSVLSYDDIVSVFNKLIKMTNNEILSIGDYMKGRSDIITSGGLILIQIMSFLNSNEIVVSTKGLRYGAYLSLIGESNNT